MTEIKMTETKKLVPVSILKGTRISREEEKSLGAFSLDGETVRTLGEESVGVFVGSSPSRRRLARLLNTLDEREDGGVVVVVYQAQDPPQLVVGVVLVVDVPVVVV